VCGDEFKDDKLRWAIIFFGRCGNVSRNKGKDSAVMHDRKKRIKNHVFGLKKIIIITEVAFHHL
jgi:hypothetical protein